MKFLERTTIKKFSCIVTVFVLFTISTIAQKSHSIYATVGKSYSLSYEGIISQTERENGDIGKLGFRIHGGNIHHICFFCDDVVERDYIAGSAVILAGKKKSFFDLCFGLGYGWQTKNREPTENITVIIANVGYRHEYDSALLRIGVGMPDLAYLSIGFRF